MNFTELHNQKSLILICNVWDVVSAKAAQKLDFKAIGTSSGAIASMLGYKDGEEISFDELEYIVKRITQSVNIPLTVDLEAGYSRDPMQIAEHIQRLAELGVIGINLEDSIVSEKREILDCDVFSKTLEFVCSELARRNLNVFINVRTDTFLLGLDDARQETITRSRNYSNAGGQGLFVPCIEKTEDIEAVVQGISLPLNVMCMPNLPKFHVLEKLGVRRISMGNFVFTKINGILEEELKGILDKNSFESLFL